MQYRKLGKWGVRVSEVALGSWLTYGNSVEENQSIKIIHKAFELGVNFFDTANMYALGNAELVVGKALKSLKRDAVVLATKVFFPMSEGPNDKGLSRKHVFEQCHASLKRLSTDYIDLYQCHRFDPDTPLEELVRTMDDLIRQGKILYWGVSEWSASQIRQAVQTASALNAPPPVSNQPIYNLLERSLEKTIMPTCKELGVGIVVFSPLAQGVLTGKYKPGQAPPKGSRATDNRINIFMLNRGLLDKRTLQQISLLSEIASSLKITTSQLALSWCLRCPEISSVIVGATKLEQLEENVQASGIVLPAEIIKQVENLFLKQPVS